MKKFAILLTALSLSALIAPTASAQVGTMDIKMEIENNNSMTYATKCPFKCIGTISTIDDVDWYSVQIGSLSTATSFTFTLTDVPTGKDYDLFVYNETGQLLGKSTNMGSASEMVTFPITAGKSYYAKVFSVSGYSTSAFYMLSADF
ncbi:hypothetical protein [Tumebacillus lipolyticus]|uniref:Peptidase C-terminal archaeal/bacterial domain-containing protein n=1 Tax=Tumebacillus lipolyticus TaxID=1280370 RepID=A0ABW5A2S7_9BACL